MDSNKRTRRLLHLSLRLPVAKVESFESKFHRGRRLDNREKGRKRRKQEKLDKLVALLTRYSSREYHVLSLLLS